MWTRVLFGAVAGLAWASALRGYMTELAGTVSTVDWTGTFLAILVPAAVVGAALGAAEHIRRTGGRPGWRWFAAAPALLAVAPLLLPGAAVALLTEGLGSGAIAVVAVGMLGGYALGHRGLAWTRALAGGLAVVGATALAAVTSVINPSLPVTTARGAWVAVTIASLLLLLAVAVSIPFRETASSEPGLPIGDPASAAS